MFRLTLFILLILINPTSFAAKLAPATILVLGDSISAAYGIDTDEGWVALLSDKITQEKFTYQVINASISGDTSMNGLNRFSSLLNEYQPKIVIIELGGNDGLRGLSIKQLKSNLQQLIETSLKKQTRVILAGMKIPPNYGKRYTEAFSRVYTELAAQYKIELIPFLLEGIGDKPNLMQADGIHPNAKAQPMIVDIVWEKLAPVLN